MIERSDNSVVVVEYHQIKEACLVEVEEALSLRWIFWCGTTFTFELEQDKRDFVSSYSQEKLNSFMGLWVKLTTYASGTATAETVKEPPSDNK